MSDSQLIRLQNIGKSFSLFSRPVLESVDLTLNVGDSLAITGPSGSGKSTLLGIIGLLDTPTEGQYYLMGNLVSQLTDSQRALCRNENFGFVFQKFNLLPNLSILENVQLPMLYSKNGLKRDDGYAHSLLNRFNLSGRSHSYPTSLSGGEQQRVALARALIRRPQFLLADEPTGSLDTENARSIMDALFSINNELGTALIVVTHDETVAQRFKSRIIVRDGRICRKQYISQ